MQEYWCFCISFTDHEESSRGKFMFISLTETHTVSWSVCQVLSMSGDQSVWCQLWDYPQQIPARGLLIPLTTEAIYVTAGDSKASCISKVICRKQGDLFTATEQFLTNEFLLATCRKPEPASCIPKLVAPSHGASCLFRLWSVFFHIISSQKHCAGWNSK